MVWQSISWILHDKSLSVGDYDVRQREKFFICRNILIHEHPAMFLELPQADKVGSVLAVLTPELVAPFKKKLLDEFVLIVDVGGGEVVKTSPAAEYVEIFKGLLLVGS